MNNQQLDIFNQMEVVNPLKDRYVCLSGEFRAPDKKLREILLSIGAKPKRREKEDENKITFRYDPTKYIDVFVVGNNPKEDAIKRIALNKHDGFSPAVINEEKLYDYLDGRFSEEDYIPIVKKQLILDISYYNWTPPIIKGKSFVSRVSSPLVYDEDGNGNPITQKEIYVPKKVDIITDVLYQIIGNLGGYANKEYYDDTNLVMLSIDTLNNLKLGNKDDVLKNIENTYNKSDAIMFNVQFTSEPDFIKWVKKRMKLYPDDSTIVLLDKYESSKQ